MKRHWQRILYWGLLAAGTLWAYSRIHTYATGQDPRTFLLLAKQLLHGGAGGGNGGLVVPGWPLVLAGVMKVAGPYAAFWTNVPLFVLLAGFLGVLAGHLSRSRGVGAVVGAGSALLLLGGCPYNPHFLLWAFRQTPIYLTATLALLFVERAVARRAEGRPWAAVGWFSGSLAWVAAGVLVRETGVLMLPAMGLYLLADAAGWIGEPGEGGQGRGRWLLAGIFAGLGVAGMLALAAGWWLGLFGGSAQVGYLLELLPHIFCDYLPEREVFPLFQMMAWIPEELGWCWFAALLLGIALSVRRRNRGYLLLFLVPALSYLLFDGMIKAHRRFFLSTLFFLAPVAMLGACGAALAAWRFARNAAGRLGVPGCWLARAGTVGRIAVWVLMAGWGATVIAKCRPWGVQATRADVERTLEAIAPCVGEDRPLLLDARARYLHEVVQVFTDWPTVEVELGNVGDCVREPPLAFALPLNEAGLHWAETGLPANRLLDRWGWFKDVPDSNFALGHSRYRLRRVVRWPQRVAVHRLPPPPGSALQLPLPPCALLRLDVPEGAAAASPRASVDGRPLEGPLASGYQYLAVPREWFGTPGEDGMFELRIEADGPIPDDFCPEWLNPDEPLVMEFGARLVKSAASYLSEEFHEYDGKIDADREFPYWKAPVYLREFRGDGEIRLPAGLGESNADYAFDFILATVYHDPEGRLELTLTLPEFPEIAPVTASKPFLSSPQTFHFEFKALPRSPRVLRIHAECKVDFPKELLGNPRHANIQIWGLTVHPRPEVESLHVRIGDSSDSVYLGEGFYARERADTPDHGRWTKGKSEVYLPIGGTRDYRLELTYLQHRPGSVPPAEPALALNGTPLEAEAADGGQAWRIPCALLAEPNLLTIETDTWRPSAHGIPDDRRLGIFLSDIRVTPY
jgi:hypothetical protein